jgi:hypothetical protein
VPKELRPPSRFGTFTDPWGMVHGEFRVTGKFRKPKRGEFFWGNGCGVVICRMDHDPIRVILEKVTP